MDKNINLIDKFIIRRAFRHGSVLRADVIKAFSLSTATATRIISAVVVKHGDIVERKKRGIVPLPLAVCPSYADEKDLLKNLDGGKGDAIYTGLFDNELPITYVSWVNSMPQKKGVLHMIVHAIQHEKQLDIIYLGLRLKEKPRIRKILPLGLEKMNDQWRVIAHDLESPQFSVKVFVLPRIFTAEISLKTKRIPIVQSYTDSIKKLNILLNYKYTPEQKKMLEHEMRVADGRVTIPERSLHEFKRRFTNQPVSADVVWPPLSCEDNE